MKRKITGLILTVISMAFLSACGSTVGENTQDYFANTGKVVKQLFSNSEAQARDRLENSQTSTADSGKTPLESPANFTVDQDGNYSFDAVNGAEYYLVYLCAPDAVSDTDTFLYTSDQIKDDGTETYSGNLSELMQYGYGDYLVKCYAYPDLMDDNYKVSTASTAEYNVAGEQSAPEIMYYWDAYSSTLGIQIANMDTYEFEAYPQEVEITFVNVDDNSDKVNTSITEISQDNFGIELTELKKGTTYRVTAVARNENDYVLNPESNETLVADAMTLGESNLYTYGYEFDDGFDRGLFNWAVVGENFNPTEGGVCGISTAYSIAAYAPGRRDFAFVATPKTPVDGAAYSYDIHIEVVYQAEDNEVIGAVASDKNKYEMSIYADGTLAASSTGDGGIVPSTIRGTWVENPDGTLTLSYDHSTIEK